MPGPPGANTSQQSRISGRTPPPELRTQRSRQQSQDQSRERRLRRQRAQTQTLPPVDSSATHLVPPIPREFGRHESLEMIDLGEENNNNVSGGRQGGRIL